MTKKKVKKYKALIKKYATGTAKIKKGMLKREPEFITTHGIEHTRADMAKFIEDVENRFSAIKEVADLPFVKDYKGDRNFWSVTPSGEYGADCETGYTYGAMTYDYIRKRDFPVLQWIVFDMAKSDMERDKGLVVGFFSFFKVVALCSCASIGSLMFNHKMARTTLDLHFVNQRRRKNFVPYRWEYRDESSVLQKAEVTA